MFESRALRIFVLAGITFGLIGVGSWLYLRPPTPAQMLQKANDYYAKGLQAYRAKDASAAALHFQEASLTAKNLLDRIRVEETKSRPPAERDELLVVAAKAHYLKARALRDEAFAKRMQDGKELPESKDSTTGADFRSFFLIEDRNAFSEAVGSLRAAAMILPKEEELQTDAIRVEVGFDPIVWTYTQHFSKSILDINPKDTRAHYLLARSDFEQPQIPHGAVSGPPTPPDKRSRSRVNDALKHVEAIKEAKEYPPGRTYFLEAQIRRWLAADFERKGEKARAEKERQAVRELVFDPKQGALAKSQNDDGTKNLSSWDIDGFLGLHLLAIDLAIEDHQKKGPALDPVKSSLASTIAFCRKMSKDKVGESLSDHLANTVVAAMSKTQGLLAIEGENEWKQALAAGREMLTNALAKDRGSLEFVSGFARLLFGEAVLAAKAGDLKRAQKVRAEAITWVTDGLATAEKRTFSADQKASVHALAAELKYATGAKSQEIESHLKQAVDAKDPRAQSIAYLLRGVIQEKEGRLEKARTDLEKALKLGNPDVDIRANLALSSVYMALGLPDLALVSLQRLEKVYDRLDELSSEEKTWLKQFLGSREDHAALQANANLEAAKKGIANFVREKPNAPIPAVMYESNETAAENILKKLAARSRQALQIRQTLVAYFAATGRMERAEKELDAALADHPNSSSLLQLDVAFLLKKAQEKAGRPFTKEEEKNLVAKIDRRIQDFLKKFPEDRPARFFWVSWLARSGRNPEAQKYLKDSANFPGAKDDAYNRMMAILLAASGDRAEAAKFVQELPQDPLIDALVIQMAETNQAKQKAVEAAMARYVQNGMFRVWNADLMFLDKRYGDAAKAFFRALDFTSVRNLARVGLQRSLLALAEDKPAEARKLADEMLKEKPDEAALLLPAALAALKLDEIGQPADEWHVSRTMAGALNAWEQAVEKTNPDRLAVALTRTEYWLKANRPDVAHVEVLRALKQTPIDKRAVLLALRLDLAWGTKDRIAEARAHLSVLQKLDPASPSTLFAEAQVEEAEGNTDTAIVLLTKLVEKHEMENVAYALLVDLSLKQKKDAKALEWAQTWMKKMPDDVIAAMSVVSQQCQAKKLADAKKTAHDFTEARLAESAKRLADRKFPDEKEPEKARKLLLDNERWSLGFRFAGAFFKGAEFAEAEVRFHQLLKENPDEEIAVLLALGDIHLARRDWAKCLDVYQKILQKDKAHFVAGNNLAYILATEMNQAPKALEVMRSVSKGRHSGKSLPGDRLHVEALDTLGTIYRRLKADDTMHREMAETFEAAHKRYPRDPRMYLYLGLAYASLNENTKAAQVLDSAIALAKDANNFGVSQTQREMVLREAEAARKRMPAKGEKR